jgi:hypothetical protein
LSGAKRWCRGTGRTTEKKDVNQEVFEKPDQTGKLPGKGRLPVPSPNVVKLSHQISHFMFKYVDAHDFLLSFPAFFIAVLPCKLRLKNPLIFLKLQSTHNLIFKQLITFVLLDFTLHYNRA